MANVKRSLNNGGKMNNGNSCRMVCSARRGGEEKKNKSLLDMHFVGKATSAVLTM